MEHVASLFDQLFHQALLEISPYAAVTLADCEVTLSLNTCQRVWDHCFKTINVKLLFVNKIQINITVEYFSLKSPFFGDFFWKIVITSTVAAAEHCLLVTAC